MTIIVTKPEIASSPIRSRVNELLYSLENDAKKNKEVERLLIEKKEAIDDAYNFSYGVTLWDENDRWMVNDTHHIACEIIALKSNYEKRIKRCRIRHKRFKTIIDQLPQTDAETLTKAFCTDIEVDEQDVKKVIRKHLKYLEQFYSKDNEKEKQCK